MGEEKKEKKKKKGKLGKIILFFLLFSFGGGGGMYFVKPKLLQKYLQKVKKLVENFFSESQQVVVIKGHKVVVEIAADGDKRRVGYGGRESIPDGNGMLFVFPKEEERTFWMKDCLVSLSVAFIRKDGTIFQIHQMDAEKNLSPNHQYKEYKSDEPTKYALEVPEGWFAKKGITVGDRVEGIEKLKIKKIE